MKMKRACLCALVLALVGLGSAWAEELEVFAHATGDVYLRSGPGLSYGIEDVIKTGADVPFLGDAAVDERGVYWYLVGEDPVRWVSSRYTVLIAGDLSGLIYDADAAADELVAQYNASLQSEPGEAGAELDVIEEGEAVQYLRYCIEMDDGLWRCVAHDGQTGWMHGESLAEAAEAAEAWDIQLDAQEGDALE